MIWRYSSRTTCWWNHGTITFIFIVTRDYENQIEKNLRWFLDAPTYKVDNYIGKTKKEIKNTQFYNYVYYGGGDTVIYQSPDQDEKIKEGDTIMLYLGWFNHTFLIFSAFNNDANFNIISTKSIIKI